MSHQLLKYDDLKYACIALSNTCSEHGTATYIKVSSFFFVGMCESIIFSYLNRFLIVSNVFRYLFFVRMIQWNPVDTDGICHGRGSEPQTRPTLECAAFAMTSVNHWYYFLIFADKDNKPP